MIVARKFSQRTVAVQAKLDPPFLGVEHVLNQLGDELVVLDVQNRNLGCGPLGSGLYDLPFDLSGFGKKMVSSLSDCGPGLEQVLVPAVY